MRKLLVLAWLFVLVLGAAYHYGPGQDRMLLDDAARILARADRAAATQDWGTAVEQYDAALAMLPEEREEQSRRIRLERNKARMLAHQLPEANLDLNNLVLELEADPAADAQLLSETREAFASSQYYLAWLMRLEGASKEEWNKEIERARQTFRLLAEQADDSGKASSAETSKENLESAIRLARLSDDELQGLNLPSQCQGCKSGKCRGKGKKPSTSPNKSEDSRGASSGPPPDNQGS